MLGITIVEIPLFDAADFLARSVVYRCGVKTDNCSRWIAAKKKKLGTTKACVAVANKNARIIWALLAKGEPCRKAAELNLTDCRTSAVMA
jgi:hypothetical protein